jgi:hypothetical protein
MWQQDMGVQGLRLDPFNQSFKGSASSGSAVRKPGHPCTNLPLKLCSSAWGREALCKKRSRGILTCLGAPRHLLCMVHELAAVALHSTAPPHASGTSCLIG